MRVLITLPNLMLQEGLALVLGGVAPQAILNRVHKKDLLQRAAEGEAPALVLIGYPWISLATLEALQVRLPDAAVIVLATNIDTAVQRRLLASHVAAIVPVSTDPEAFAATLRVVMCGDVTVHGRALRDETGVLRARARQRVDALNLTPRQFDVLALIANGRTNKAIAGELGVGLRTVKGHVAVILRAMHTDNRRDAGRHARRWFARVRSRAGTGLSGSDRGIG